MSGYNRAVDPFSRRPTDDRRPVDPRDRRRESYGRSVSDSHDRYRDRGRDDGSPPRERGPAYDLSREPTKQTHSSSSRSDATSGRGTKSASDNRSIDGASCVESIGRALTSWTKDIEILLVEKARLMYHKEQLQKVQSQRKTEYQRSMHKHADFPAIPELQSKYRAREEAELKKLESHERKVDEKMLKLRETLPSELQQSLSPADFQRNSDSKEASLHTSIREVESKVASLKNTLQQQLDSTRNRLDALRTQFSELEAKYDQEQKDFKSEIAQQRKEFQSEIAQQRKDFQSDVAKLRQEFTEQLQNQREDMAKDRAISQAERTKFEAQIAEQEVLTRTLVEEQREQLTSGPERATASEVAALRDENTILRSENATLRSDVALTTAKVEELMGKLEQQAQDTRNIYESINSREQEMKGLRRKVEDHQGKLMHIETQIWEEVAEAYTFGFPKLQADVKELQQSYQRLVAKKGSGEGSPAPAATSAVEVFEKKANSFQLNIITKVGTLIDELRSRDRELESQIKDLRAQTTVESTTRSDAHPRAPPNSSAGEDLKRDYTVLLQQFAETEKELRKVSEEVSQKTNYLTHQFNILQAQYNNLTTKELAQHILGQLETIYPDSRKIMADIGQLSATTEKMKKEQAEQAGEVKVAKQEVTELKRKFDTYVLPTWKESADRTNKKRKADTDPETGTNGVGNHTRVNGVRPLNGEIR